MEAQGPATQAGNALYGRAPASNPGKGIGATFFPFCWLGFHVFQAYGQFSEELGSEANMVLVQHVACKPSRSFVLGKRHRFCSAKHHPRGYVEKFGSPSLPGSPDSPEERAKTLFYDFPSLCCGQDRLV